MKEIIYSPNAPEPLGPYSQAIMVDSTLYCSGQIAVGCLDRDITEQTERVCKNILAVIEAAGMSLDDVVKTTCYLTKMEDFSLFNKIYEIYFSHKPARSCVAVLELPKGALVEIEIMAIRN